MMRITPVTPEDQKAIVALFALDKKIWPGGIGQGWYWFWHSPARKEFWVKVTEGETLLGSAHWSERRDGSRNLRDIIVVPAARGKGVGRLLIEHIGRPIVCKTDHDSEANGFYQHLGFVKGETLPSRNGRKLLTAYFLGNGEKPIGSVGDGRSADAATPGLGSKPEP